ncbi:MAG: enoyl-CoA hydratase-related protein [Parvularcula sp.]|nr:enoyl-CoA hydratase-related protein [Parvularcula sp.]
MTEHVILRRDSAILHARLNRPGKKNAMTDEMYEALYGAFVEAEENKDVRVLMLSAEGDSFTAGNDLAAFVRLMNPEGLNDPPVLRLIEAGLKATVPVVAAVQGWCVGIGATMMLHTDFIYAEKTARFHMPFTQLGAVPEAGASRLLVRRLGRQRAAQFMLSSDVISAPKAESFGFITEAVPEGEALMHAERTAKKLAELPAEAMRATKRLMQEELETLLPHTRHELEVFAERLRSAEMQNVIAARMKG